MSCTTLLYFQIFMTRYTPQYESMLIGPYVLRITWIIVLMKYGTLILNHLVHGIYEECLFPLGFFMLKYPVPCFVDLIIHHCCRKIYLRWRPGSQVQIRSSSKFRMLAANVLCTSCSVITYASEWFVPLTQPNVAKNRMGMCVDYHCYCQLLQVQTKLGDLVSEADHQIWRKWIIM